MSKVIIAGPTRLAAESGASCAAQGGNAVDAAVAAALVAMISEPGICALGAGGFVTIAPPESEAVTIDGNVAMPGLGLEAAAFGKTTHVARIDYGGGVTTTVGYESVGVPGGVAALGRAASHFGRLPWSTTIQPAIDVSEQGFPLSTAAAYYLTYSHDEVFGWNAASHQVVHRPDGTPRRAGDRITIDGLAETLRTLAVEGPEALYTGSLARRIVADFAEHGGLITARDLAEYDPVVRPCAATRVGHWTISTNPPPSVGGPVLLAMLELAEHGRTVAEAQRAALEYRAAHLDLADDLSSATRQMVHDIAEGGLLGWLSSPSTVHVSATDEDGLSCSITMSAGYGSGVMPAGTGIWMNNSLGEIELNRRGYHVARPGTRLPSNMAPTVVRGDAGESLAIGSPGADRITTALQQVLLAFAEGEALQDAIDAPRLHVELSPEGPRIAHEPGVPLNGSELPTRPFDDRDMFFGGVSATMRDRDGELHAAADPRRTGGTARS